MRKIIFWLHLTAGVSAGLVILMMSVTGVILTYERQILAWEDRNHYDYTPVPGESRLSVENLLASTADNEAFSPTSIILSADPNAAVILRAGRSASRHINPYNGDVYQAKSDKLDGFFSAVTAWHRWFNISGENRSKARAVTGASNLLFLFLLCSGLYLWLPAIFKWSTMRLRLWFHPNAKSGSARDFNWHHVFGFWFALPLLVVIATATVFNYGWANNLVYRMAGDTPPQRTNSARQAITEANTEQPLVVQQELMSLDSLAQIAAGQEQSWRNLTLTLPDSNATTVAFTYDMGNGGQPQKRHNLVLDRQTGEIVEWSPFGSLSSGRQARSWVRFLHTGEALGLPGQTIAGLASMAGVLLVWTGLSLALRRFLGFISRTKRARTSPTKLSTQTNN